MKKSLLSIILAVTLVISGQTMVFAEAETQAEEEGLGDFLRSLFTEDGALSGLVQEGGIVDELLQDEHIAQLLPEGIDAEALVGTLRDQLADGNSELYQAADKLYDYVTNEDGSLNEDALMELASGLFAGKGEDDGAASGEEMMQQMKAMQNAVKELNADAMEAGDAQSVIFMASPTVAQEDGSCKVLGFFPGVTGDPLKFCYLLCDVSIDLFVFFIHRLLSLAEAVFALLNALELAVDILFLLLDPSLCFGYFSPSGLELSFILFSQLMYFLFRLKHFLLLEVLDSILRVQDHVPGLLFRASYGFLSEILAQNITNCYTDDKDYNADHNS